jgi:hypothetical protein
MEQYSELLNKISTSSRPEEPSSNSIENNSSLINNSIEELNDKKK